MPVKKVKETVPVNAVDPDQLKPEAPLKYDFICKIIGELYLESFRRTSLVEDQAKSLVDKLNQEAEMLRKEVRDLRKKLEEDTSGSK